jgi:hypothetical protein
MLRNAPSPETVAALAFEGIRADRFYVFTTARYDEPIRARTEAILSRTNPDFESLVSLSKDDTDMTGKAA